MAASSVPGHLKTPGESTFEGKHHGKSQSHVVSFIHFPCSLFSLFHCFQKKKKKKREESFVESQRHSSCRGNKQLKLEVSFNSTAIASYHNWPLPITAWLLLFLTLFYPLFFNFSTFTSRQYKYSSYPKNSTHTFKNFFHSLFYPLFSILIEFVSHWYSFSSCQLL